MLTELIRKNPLFTNLPDHEIRALEEVIQESYFPIGKVLFEEGSKSNYFYLLIDGEVEVIKSLGTPDERKLAINSPGSILGEMGRFSQDGSHTASVVANTPCRLLKVPFSWLDSVLNHHPEKTYGLMRLITSRLDHSENLTIKELREKNRQLTQAYHDLKIAQAAMIEKEKLDQEMRLAGKIQRSILPKALPRFPDMDFGALMIPAEQVGGDFYDFIVLDDQQVGIVIGDVCDKGMPAALLMALTYSSVRMEALRKGKPGDIMQKVNQHLIQIDCADMFVTLLYGIFDYKTMQFDFARAGHPPPLLYDADQQPLTVPYDYGQALGIFDEFHVDEGCISIPEGGTLLLYSDGLSETIDEHQSSPGLSQICSSILDNYDINAQECCDQLWRLAGGSTGESMIKDDFTVIVIKSMRSPG